MGVAVSGYRTCPRSHSPPKPSLTALSGVASSETIDAYGHLVKADAFEASIAKRGISGPGGVKLLAFHDPQRPAGRISRLTLRMASSESKPN